MPQPDTSLYPHTPDPANPLKMIGEYQGISNAMMQNRLMQQEQLLTDRKIKGQAALGNAIQQSLNPDGSTNQNKLNQLVSSDPDASWMALQVQNEARGANPLTDYIGRNAKGQPQSMQAPESTVRGMGNPGQKVPSQEELKRIRAHNQAMIRALEPLTNDPDLDHKKAMNTVVDLVADPEAQFNAMDGGMILSKLPHGPNGTPPSGEQLRPHIQQELEKQKGIAAHLDQHYPEAAEEDQSTPGSATELPAGYAENQSERLGHYKGVLNAANSVPVENAALNNILNISKSGAPSGTIVGDLYKAFASVGVFPDSVTDSGTQLKLMQNHMTQLALAGGMPGSDQRLHALENAKVGDKDLPQVIQAMVPYLLAVNNGKIRQAKFYQQVAGDGTNPEAVTKAQSMWNENFDPRVLEIIEMQDNPEELKKFKSRLSKEDRHALARKIKTSAELGILE